MRYKINPKIDVFPAYLTLWARYAGKFERKRAVWKHRGGGLEALRLKCHESGEKPHHILWIWRVVWAE
jgi:hypothetical protein